MRYDITDKERFVLLVIFALTIMIYFLLGMMKSSINPLIKLIPFFCMLAYIIIKPRLQKKNKK